MRNNIFCINNFLIILLNSGLLQLQKFCKYVKDDYDLFGSVTENESSIPRYKSNYNDDHENYKPRYRENDSRSNYRENYNYNDSGYSRSNYRKNDYFNDSGYSRSNYRKNDNYYGSSRNTMNYSNKNKWDYNDSYSSEVIDWNSKSLQPIIKEFFIPSESINNLSEEEIENFRFVK